MRTPEILQSAVRQFRHNNSDELVIGFDYEEIIKIVTSLQAAFLLARSATAGLTVSHEAPAAAWSYEKELQKAEDLYKTL